MRFPVNLSRFDLASLRLFVATLDSGSLTAGAARFGISLAAASKRIAELESHVGLSLLARSKRGVAATPAGQTLQRHAIEVVARLEQLAVAMNDFHRGTHGHLRLWANTSAFGGFLPALLAAYSAAHPDITIDLEDALSEDAVRAVVSGAAELAVVGENTPCGGLHTFVCDRDELMLLVPAGHRAGPGGGAGGAGACLARFAGIARFSRIAAAREARRRTRGSRRRSAGQGSAGGGADRHRARARPRRARPRHLADAPDRRRRRRGRPAAAHPRAGAQLRRDVPHGRRRHGRGDPAARRRRCRTWRRWGSRCCRWRACRPSAGCCSPCAIARRSRPRRRHWSDWSRSAWRRPPVRPSRARAPPGRCR